MIQLPSLPTGVTLLAVSKGQPIEKIAAAIQMGQRRFGENYLQEALEKIQHFNDPTIEWHFIGSIQSNKTKKIAENFSWVHTVASINIAKRLNDQRPAHLPPLNICIQVNSSNEDSKSGVPLNEAADLLKACLLLPRLSVRGFMAIPKPQTTLIKQREEYKAVSALFHSLQQQGYTIDTLSIGMSEDMEAAIAEGATLVRIGRAIFGERS